MGAGGVQAHASAERVGGGAQGWNIDYGRLSCRWLLVRRTRAGGNGCPPVVRVGLARCWVLREQPVVVVVSGRIASVVSCGRLAEGVGPAGLPGRLNRHHLGGGRRRRKGGDRS